MTKPVKRRCIDCGERVKNRSKTTKRCSNCNLIFKRQNKTGRATGTCLSCGTKLSQKKNVTGKCIRCRPNPPHLAIWQRTPGVPPWNKGKTKFSSAEERRLHFLKKRKELRDSRPVDIADRIRTLIRNSLRNASTRKTSKTATLLGCDTAFFRRYLEARFSEGMTRANYGNGHGRWNIDHIRPLITFDLSDPAQQLEAFHYTNCRPFWAIDNVRRAFVERNVAASGGFGHAL